MEQRLTRASERRKAEYRKLLDEAEILQEEENTGLDTLRVVSHIVEEANKLFQEGEVTDRVQHTDEILLDAKVVAAASDILYNVTEAIDVAIDSYDPIDLGSRIRKKYLTANDETGECNWSNLSKIAYNIMKFPPSFSSLYGPVGSYTEEVNKQPKKKPQPRSSKKEEHGPINQPEKLTSINKEEDSVDDTVKFLQWALNKHCEENEVNEINYFNFLIDPDNFTATIENMFHMSFLVRDGRVKLKYDKNEMLTLSPVTSAELKKAKRENLPFQQNIISLDMKKWKELTKGLKIRSCLLEKWREAWQLKKAERTK